MFSTSPGVKKFLATAAAAFIVTTGAFGGYLAAVQYAETSWHVLAGARQELIQLEKRRMALTVASRTFPDFGRKREIIQAAFIDPSEPLPLIESIEGLGRRDGVITKLTLAATPGGAGGEEYVLSVNGSFHNVMSFLAHLESLRFLAELRDTELDRIAPVSAEKTAPPSIAMSTTIRLIPR